MNTITIIRHAEKEQGDFFNPSLSLQDPPISPKGREEAQKLVPFFADKKISAIYVSAYQRTAQTIEPVARQLGLTPIIDERLNEINNGCIERMSDEEVQQNYPEVWKAYTERKSDFRFPGGETGAEAQQRLAAFLEEKRLQLDGGDIIAVCHDALIRLLVCYVLEMPVYHRWKFKVDFCGLTEIMVQDDEWKLIRFNQRG